MLFEVIKAPDGASPQWVRDAWVGVQFQATHGAPVSMAAQSAGTSVKHSRASERRGYPTNARDLLGLLSLVSEDAARWYLENAPHMADPAQVFIFDEVCCRAIAELS